MMNFSHEKCKKLDKKTLNFAMGMFRSNNRIYWVIFTPSKYYIQSCFLPLCKILAHVGFAVANNVAILQITQIDFFS